MPPQPVAVTFDCWSTLIVDAEPGWGPPRRAKIFAEVVGVGEETARSALAAAWRRHQVLWHRRVAFTPSDMVAHALHAVNADFDAAATAALVERLEAQALDHPVRALAGAVEALELLARRGVRRALICDTGFTPGRVVRRLLDRVGLLEYLEAAVFSDEVGVPKPDPKPFETALSALGVGVQRTVHVGDLRRSDIEGARVMGMGAVRLALHHDDVDDVPSGSAGVIDCAAAECNPTCPRPEGDVVARSYEDVLRALGVA